MRALRLCLGVVLAAMVVAVWQRRDPVIEAYTEERAPVQFTFDGLDFAIGQRVDLGPSPLLVPTAVDTKEVGLPQLRGTVEAVVDGLPIGSVRFGGIVSDGVGPVPFATVRVEHHGVAVSGGSPIVSSLDVLADENGAWELTGVGGGRWRVRAFVPDQLASTEPTVRFIPSGETVVLDLNVAPPDPSLVLTVASPTSRELDQSATVAVSVGRRRVDGEGIVVIDPVPGAGVEMVLGSSPLRAVSAVLTSTDAAGTARFGVVCESVGSSQATFPVLLPAGTAAETAAPGTAAAGGSVTSSLTTCVPLPPPPETEQGTDPATSPLPGQEGVDG